MGDTGSTLVLSRSARVRPTACGCLVSVTGAEPIPMGDLHERILAVCARSADRAELVVTVAEATGLDTSVVDSAVSVLVDMGALVSGSDRPV